tara:strand:- start:22 stop:330 length:309 start_codon:yes stop_codon:yes gene_type:complete
MIIYNVTVSVEEGITRDWLDWIETQHIPEVMSCGIFIKAQINRVVTEADSNNTFAIAYTCLSMKDLHKYQIDFSTQLQKKHIERFGEKAVAFRTILEVIKEF